MKFKFKEDVELEVVIGLEDNDEQPIIQNEFFKSNEIHDVDLLEEREYIDDKEKEMDIQFGDGSCVFNLNSNLIEVIEE